MKDVCGTSLLCGEETLCWVRGVKQSAGSWAPAVKQFLEFFG